MEEQIKREMVADHDQVPDDVIDRVLETTPLTEHLTRADVHRMINDFNQKYPMADSIQMIARIAEQLWQDGYTTAKEG